MANEYYNKVNVLNLPRVNVINDNDYLIVQNDNDNTQTSLLQFKNFVVDLKNTTFASAIENMENNAYLINNRINYIADRYNTLINVLTSESSPFTSEEFKNSIANCIINLSSIA